MNAAEIKRVLEQARTNHEKMKANYAKHGLPLSNMLSAQRDRLALMEAVEALLPAFEKQSGAEK